jgi:hypothetical protein
MLCIIVLNPDVVAVQSAVACQCGTAEIHQWHYGKPHATPCATAQYNSFPALSEIC